MNEPRERLDDLARRVERMAVAPEQVRAPWTRLARPLLRLLGWQPVLETARLRQLLQSLRSLGAGDSPEACDRELAAALEELEGNVLAAERACVVNGSASTGQIAWLQRLLGVMSRASASLALEGGAQAARAVAAIDPLLLEPPLMVATEPAAGGDAAATRAEADKPAPDVQASRLIELQLGAIDHVIEAARAETSFLERRRRLLEAARRLLLDADAALELDAEGVRLRKRHLAQQIVHIDRLQAAGLSPQISLLHQARTALSRGERGRLFAALVAMEGFATAAGDSRVADAVSDCIEGVVAGGDVTSDDAAARSLNASVRELLGDDVASAIGDAYQRAYREAQRQDAQLSAEAWKWDLALEYLAPGSERETMSALLAADGCFDVGAPLTPVRVTETETYAQVVSHPTDELILTRARGPSDLAGAVVNDPRSLMLDLATGRLLTRKFVRYEQRRKQRTELVGEVRIYLLDGSTSMLDEGTGASRARMRDAILTAELATLLRRYQRPQRFTRVVMFYRYFTKQVWPVTRVGNADEALAAIGEVLSSQRTGGTDIEKALRSCFDMVRVARQQDSELGRAQIVLITDGNAMVRDRFVREAREKVGEIPIAVSVIALGQQNAALRRLVARQRQRGERAFYHFIDDDTLSELSDGRLDAGRVMHLPDDPATASELSLSIGGLLDEAAELQRKRHRLVLHPPEELEQAFEELGLSEEHLSEGARAQREAAERDRRALLRRYGRWFPPPPPQQQQGETLLEAEGDVDAVVVALSTVAEVVGELGGSELARKADAVEILERLLPDARLSPARYEATLRSQAPSIATSLEAVHAATAPTPTKT